jgi:hypothetical protein
MVDINLDGLFANFEIILPDLDPCFPCNSICNLFDEMKAISIPENRAENDKQIAMRLIKYGSIQEKIQDLFGFLSLIILYKSNRDILNIKIQ